MKNKIFELIKWELLVAHKISNITTYLLCFFLFCNFSLLLIIAHQEIKTFGMIFTTISMPLAMLAFANLLFKPDYNDGNLELLLINFTPMQIVSAKYISLFICCFGGTLINFPIMLIFFDINFYQAVNSMFSLLLFMPLVVVLLILVGAVQCYFQTNTNYLSLLVMPLLIPSIVISGLMIFDPQKQYYNYVLLAMDFMVVPGAFFLTGYLIRNIYNI